MKASIIFHREKKYFYIRRCMVTMFWLCVWQGLAMLIGQEILFSGPVEVAKTLARLIVQGEFWGSIASSFCKISIGFFAGFLLGIFLAVAAYKLPFIKELLAPLIALMKSIPVASFIIVVLIWVNSDQLSVFISFFVVFPVIYLNVLAGLGEMDEKMLEMAKIFRMRPWKVCRYLYPSFVMPYVISASRIGLGMCWKAGIAAEVIGLPEQSIGEQLYLSKVYLDTGSLFAWTIVIVAVSVLFERIFIFLLVWAKRRLER